MEQEVVGLHAQGGRWRPVAAGPFSLLAVALALLPIRPVWLWAGLIAAVAAAPWLLGAAPDARRRTRPYWRLSASGLERLGPGGLSMVAYERSRIEALALTTDDGVLTVFHKFGRTSVGDLAAMGMEPLPLFVTARRLGITMHVLDGEAADLLDPALEEGPRVPALDDTGLPRDQAAEQRLLDQEAQLLQAAHDEAPPDRAPKDPVRLASPSPLPSRRRIAVLGGLAGLLGVAMVIRTAAEGAHGFGPRLAAGCWALAAITVVMLARRRLLRASRVEWEITADRLHVRARPGRRDGTEILSSDIAALVLGPGLRLDPVTGDPKPTPVSALAFDHRLRLIARLPAHGLDAFQLAHALDDHGYRVITPGTRSPRTPDYGLDGLPEIFAQVPGGRLVVADDGLGWADAAGDVVLRMPQDRIGGIELLTISGHAWVRLYDSDGDEFFAAPLSALRISRTDLRESARRVGLPITDAEYDAYLSAAFHSAVSTLSAPVETTIELAPPVTEPGVLLDATRRSRVGTYGMSVLLCEFVALLGSVWLGPDLGGFLLTASWALPAGLVVGLGGYWLYDRNRAQLRVSAAGLAVITKRGRVEWDLARDRVGGVGIDDSSDRMPRLVVWSPAGRVLRHVTFPPDLVELRRACEKFGLPWGPPDADRPAPPPPEL
ncbi:hypothetical protein [Spirillospora sp. NPDC047279]|uniref:hypothetical protein n=1 Tax=Spirillospora sp. NPDC047279 TaxID=3155478 RepID=UPI0033FCBFCA